MFAISNKFEKTRTGEKMKEKLSNYKCFVCKEFKAKRYFNVGTNKSYCICDGCIGLKQQEET